MEIPKDSLEFGIYRVLFFGVEHTKTESKAKVAVCTVHDDPKTVKIKRLKLYKNKLGVYFIINSAGTGRKRIHIVGNQDGTGHIKMTIWHFGTSNQA